ncbi:hypothetical protein Glove_188g55 [Diversispora epigaea]|uniref:Uncharacterized protein n=1 Tax=Diversispora epigaea TaxID=1348612 RepID=A0A397IUN2_9GLOM|nr:hypothetical protein Glove_188g55 [Diversispora epigaea]
MSNLNELFKKKKQNPLRTSSYSRASSSRPSSASASRPSSASALRPSSASALRPSSASALRPSSASLRPSSASFFISTRIFSKLDNLKTLLEKVKKNQEDMKEEIKTIKEEVAILSHDQACIDVTSRPSSASALRPSSASASRPSLFPRPLLESEDSDLTSSSVDQMNDAVTRRIFSKLDNLKTLLEKVKKNQEDMKEEIKTIKEEVAILSHDQACIDAVIIKSAQDLLEKKIYSNYDEFKESAEFFLRESDNEFFSTLGSKWEPYFEKKIRKPLLKRLRSFRGTLCARVKTAIFENFSNMLPSISNVAKASEIAAWKKKLAVSNCFRKLFEKIEDDEMTHI